MYGTFAFAFSTLFCALWAPGVFDPAALLFVPLVAANAYSWTWPDAPEVFLISM